MKVLVRGRLWNKELAKANPHHVACIAIKIFTDTDLMNFKLGANRMQVIDVTKSKIAKKKNLIVRINAIIPIIDKTFWGSKDIINLIL